MTWLLADVTTDPVIQWLSGAGSVGILSAGIIGFMRGWIVSGRTYDQVRAERDRALELVYQQAGLAHRTVDISMARLEFEEKLLELTRKERDAPPPAPA